MELRWTEEAALDLDLVHAFCDTPRRGRSTFLTDLAKREVHRLKLIELLERPDQPPWNLEEHPELKNGAAQEISEMRQEDERIDSETETH